MAHPPHTVFPTERVQTRRGTPNWELLSASVLGHIRLQRYARHAVHLAERRIQKADREVVHLLQSSSRLRGRTLTHAVARAKRVRQQLWTDVLAETRAELARLAFLERRSEARRIRRALKNVPDVQVDELDDDYETPETMQGNSLTVWFRSFAARDVLILTGILREAGNHNVSGPNLVTQVAGNLPPSLGRSWVSGGVLATSRNGASSLIRTAVNATVDAVHRDVWLANSELIRSELWVSVIDGKTSQICRARDGQKFPVGKGPRPPAHLNCRSVRVAVLDGPVLMDVETGIADTLTFEEWVSDQPEEVQDEVLGSEQGRLFREGRTLADFVDTLGTRYTITQLETLAGV